ncbi:MAG: hypothetical protein ACI4JB_06025 [Porcipelethomonas sp.]
MKKNVLKKVLTVIVTMAMFTMFSQPMVEAATTKFISEVVLVYGKDLEEAKGKLDGTGYDILPKNLNDGTSKFNVDSPDVYLAYKTSTDVEDAITDFAVMDMDGGYNMSGYEEQLKKNYDEYKELIDDYQIVSAEFKKNYDAGSFMAKSAYRQMNFYIDDDTQMLLGDFMMNIPDADALATVLMQGNVKVINNLSVLLAMGVSGTDEKTFEARYQENAKTPEKFNDPSYYDDAKVVSDSFEKLVTSLVLYERELESKEDADESSSSTDESSTSIDESEDEEFVEDLQYSAIAPMYECLKSVEYGNSTMLDLIMSMNWQVEDFYPMIASMTDGQRALTRLGYIQYVLSYNATKQTADELENMLDEAEKMITEKISVYLGVDRSIFTGNFAFTTDALRHEADTGDSFFKNTTISDHTASLALAASGFILLTFSVITKSRIYIKHGKGLGQIIKDGGDYYDFLPSYEEVLKYEEKLHRLKIRYYGLNIALGVGLLLMAASAGLEIWDYYHPEYKEIPGSLIDIIETENSAHYVKYDAVMNIEPQERKLDDGTKVQEIVPGDLNGFFGKQWNALYVTKDFTAGKPLTATKINYSNDTDTPAKGYAPVHYFGEEVAYNLNNHHYSSSKNVFLSFKQSNEKKAAEASVPETIATNLSYGISAITGGAGIVAGMGIMRLICYRKKKVTNAKGEE